MAQCVENILVEEFLFAYICIWILWPWRVVLGLSTSLKLPDAGASYSPSKKLLISHNFQTTDVKSGQPSND